MNFFSISGYLSKKRNRTFLQSFTTAGTILSEGAWQIEIVNSGDEDITLNIEGITTVISSTLPQPYLRRVILPGEPYLKRDDIIPFTFAGGGVSPLMEVYYHKIVNRRDQLT